MLEKEIPRNRKPQPNIQRIPQKDPLENVFKRTETKKLTWDLTTGFRNDSFQRRRGYKLALWSWAASIIDGLVLVTVSCIFLMAFSFIMNSPLKQIVGDIKITTIPEIFFIVYLLSAWLYLMTLRVLIGKTIGEWACQLQLGKPEDQKANNYQLKVFFRTTLIMVTGVFVLPLFSLVLGEDIPGAITGVRIFSFK